jgi:acyl-CoA thioester hydrolase
MARVHIDLPQSFPFRTELPLYIQHINGAGHLDNAALLSLASEARARFFLSTGYAEQNVEGLGTVVADTAVQYRSEAFYGEVLAFDLAPVEFNKYGFDLVWRATEATSGREVACGKTGIVFLDYATRRVARAPEGFVRHFVGKPTS